MIEHIFIWLTSQTDVSDRERDLLHQVSELQARWDPVLGNLEFMNLISWLQLNVHGLVRVCYLQLLVVNDVILLTLERSLALGFMGFWSISRTAYRKLIWLFLELMYWPVWHEYFVWQGDNPNGWAAKCQIEKCWGTVFKILDFNCPILRLIFFPHWKYGNTISTAAKVWYVVDISLQVSVPPTTLISTSLKLEVKQKPAMEHCRTQVGWNFHAVWSQLAPEIHVVGWWWQLATYPQTAREFELVLLGSFQDDSRMLSLVN
jgi:hypothetical protein